HLAEKPRARAEYGERKHIVEQVLNGVDDPGILQRLEQAVDEPRHRSPLYAEHIRIQRYREQREHRYRSAVRSVEKFDVRQSERQSYAYRSIDYGHGVRSARELFSVR